MSAVAVVVVGTVLALALWVFLFRRPSDGIWGRTWVAAASLSAYSLVALAVTERLAGLVGPVSAEAVLAGLGVGVAWLVATHIGHAVLCRIFPGFLAQISDLYSLREGDRVLTIAGPLTAMGIAEEVFFRGVVQGRLGLVAAVAVYSGVQLVVNKWSLTLAAMLGGVVWGGLYWWQGGIIAPAIAHVLWTGVLTLLWPLRGCGERPGGSDVAPLASGTDTVTGEASTPRPAGVVSARAEGRAQR
ncbi:MAG: CPBP family intramembrane glutamic endopeptidase [Acidimicrobiales bacterium]